MPARIPVTDAMVAREFRLQRVPGSAVDAITNPLIRRCLALGAEARRARRRRATGFHRDAKTRAANDND